MKRETLKKIATGLFIIGLLGIMGSSSVLGTKEGTIALWIGIVCSVSAFLLEIYLWLKKDIK